MAEARRSAPPSGLLLGLGFTLLAGYVWALIGLARTGTYETMGALVVGPVLFLISLPILARQARREGNPGLLWFLILALALKLTGAILRHYVAYGVYGGVADATAYHRWGEMLAAQFRAGNFDTGLDSFTETEFIRLLTGIVYTIIGTSRLGGFVFFSWLAFWGLFLLYRAFLIAVPEGRGRTYARLIFLYPSLLYWPSSIGKEAWMLFAIGIAAFGMARALTGRTGRGLAIAGLGLWFAALVRPHVAGLIGLALVGAYVLRRPRKELRQLAPIGKVLGLAAVSVLGVILMVHTQNFLKGANLLTPEGVVETLEGISQQSAQGGSEFDPPVVRSPVDLPMATATVLFRPFIPEAHNVQAFGAAVEGTFLLLLSVVRFRWFLRAVGSVRRQPYVALALIYAVMFIVAFSSLPNFGLLARERVQLIPFYFVLFSVPPRPQDRVSESASPEEAVVG